MFNLGSLVFLSMGNAVGILMGQMLGSGAEKAAIQSYNRKLLAFATVAGGSFGIVIIAFSGAFPHLYNTTEEVRALATKLICVSGFMMPFNSFTNASYFTLRSGGQTMVTFLFDSCFVWVVCVPLAFCLSRFTSMGILPLYFLVQATDWIKCVLGSFMLKQGKWIQNLTV
jgi:Na+-driven multidrug efflux pump